MLLAGIVSAVRRNTTIQRKYIPTVRRLQFYVTPTQFAAKGMREISWPFSDPNCSKNECDFPDKL